MSHSYPLSLPNGHYYPSPYGKFKSLHHIRPAQGSNLVPKQVPGTSEGFRLSSASKGIRIRTQSHRPMQALAMLSLDILQPFLGYSLNPSGEAILKVCPPSSLDYSTRHGCQTLDTGHIKRLKIKLLVDLLES